MDRRFGFHVITVISLQLYYTESSITALPHAEFRPMFYVYVLGIDAIFSCDFLTCGSLGEF